MSSRFSHCPSARITPVISPAGHSRSDAERTPSAALFEIRQAAAVCKACDLWKNATQTVFGEGKPGAAYMMVGEQPGDSEDRKGRPFVGPAGRLLDKALTEAGIDRRDVYVTNVVKHFKWSLAERGKKRIHKKPRDSEIEACRPWLDAELQVVKPKVLVCLGASAAQSLLGKGFRVSRQRGQIVDSDFGSGGCRDRASLIDFACGRRGVTRGTAKAPCSGSQIRCRGG